MKPNNLMELAKLKDYDTLSFLVDMCTLLQKLVI